MKLDFNSENVKKVKKEGEVFKTSKQMVQNINKKENQLSLELSEKEVEIVKKITDMLLKIQTNLSTNKKSILTEFIKEIKVPNKVWVYLFTNPSQFPFEVIHLLLMYSDKQKLDWEGLKLNLEDIHENWLLYLFDSSSFFKFDTINILFKSIDFQEFLKSLSIKQQYYLFIYSLFFEDFIFAEMLLNFNPNLKLKKNWKYLSQIIVSEKEIQETEEINEDVIIIYLLSLFISLKKPVESIYILFNSFIKDNFKLNKEEFDGEEINSYYNKFIIKVIFNIMRDKNKGILNYWFVVQKILGITDTDIKEILEKTGFVTKNE